MGLGNDCSAGVEGGQQLVLCLLARNARSMLPPLGLPVLSQVSHSLTDVQQ